MTRPVTVDASRALRAIALLLGIAALYLASGILIPTALAILLAFLLSPPTRWLELKGLSRSLAVSVTVVIAFTLTAAITFLVAKQAVDLSMRLPDYQENLRLKARALRGSSAGTLERLSGTLKGLEEELSATMPASTQTANAAPPPIVLPPVKVEVVEEEPSLGELAAMVFGPLMAPLGQAGITLVLLVFLLLYRDDLRGRILSLAGMRQLSLTTAAMSESSERIGRYLLMQLIINVLHGAMMAIGLYVVGVPNAMLWGVLG